MKITWAGWLVLAQMALVPLARAEIGTRVAPPSTRGYAVQAIREAGERGGLLQTVGTNFTDTYNREMGDAMETWNAHHWADAVSQFNRIWREHPDSPWAAEAELHEACFCKFNGKFDDAEERFVSILQKYPDAPQIRARVLHYLPHLYAQTGRMQAALDAHVQMQNLPMTWQERQHLENYSRIFARALAKDNEDRLCGTKALALAMSVQNDKGEALRNVSMDSVYKRFAWSQQKATDADGFSLQELADLSDGKPMELDLDALRKAASPGHPVLVYLNTPSEPKCFTVLDKPKHEDEQSLTGHFVVVENVGDGFVDLLDPDAGRVRWPLSHFTYRWSGAVLKLPGQDAISGKAISADLAATLRGGCCGSPPPDPDNDGCSGGGGGGSGGSGGGSGGSGGGGGGGGGLVAGAKCIAGNCGGSGNGNGYGNGSGSGSGSSGCPGSCEGDGSCGCGSPAYSFGLASANLSLGDIPMWYPNAKGPRMLIELIYNRVDSSRMAQYTNANYYAFGNKWHFNLASYLTETPDGGVEIVLPGGRVQKFLTNGDNYVSADVWNLNTLARSNQWFVLTFKSSEDKWYFNTNTLLQQRLEKIEDRYGNAVALQYDDVSGRLTNTVDAAGRAFQLQYNVQGYVTNITDSLGRSGVFAYNASNDLVSMTDMGGLTTTIQYDTNHWPTNIIYPSSSALRFTYENGLDLGEPYSGFAGYPALRMRAVDALNQTNEYFYYAYDYMGPVTVKDRAGNNWMSASKQVGGDMGSQRIYYRAVNASVPYPYTAKITGDQWEHFTYDADMNLIQTAIANANFTTSIGFSYVEGSWIANVLTTNLYDANHNLISRTILTNYEVVGTWTNWYDNRDNLLGTKNPLNQITRYTYDDKDKLLAVTNALNQVTGMAYDSNGNLTNLVDALNRANRWTYDTNGREIEATYADGLTISKGYDAIGRLTAVTNNGSGLVLHYNYDNLDRMTDSVFPDGTSNHFQYACCGLEWTRDRLGRMTYYDHDALQRVSQVTDPLNRITQFHYNGADQITNLITYVGGQQRVKQFDYTSTNGFTRLAQVITPMGKLTRYDYTFLGGLAWRQDGNGNVTKYQYDTLNRLVSVTDSNNAPLVNMTYDVLNNVTSLNSFNTDSLLFTSFSYSYDSLNRVTNTVCVLTNIPGFATVKYRIDYAFDAVGNVTNRVITGLQGMSDTIATRYAYDTMNRLTNVTQLTNSAASANAGYAYDSAGRLWQKTYGNNDVVTHSYDAESRLLTLGITNNTSLVTAYSYQWDAAGNILAITNVAGGATTASRYSYDAAGQLTNEISSTETNSWQYDEAGNWLNGSNNSQWLCDADNELLGRVNVGDTNWNVTVTGTVEPGPNSNKWYHTTASCRGVNVLVNTNSGTFSLPNVPLYLGTNLLQVSVTDVSGNTYTTNRTVVKDCFEMFAYDNNGNLTNWVNGNASWSYQWDWADRLTKVSSNSVVVLQNWYDASGRRIAKQEVVNGQTNKTVYIYDGWNSAAVLNENGQLLESYARGVGLAGDIGTLVAVTHHAGSITNGTFYIHNNHRGDITLTRSGTTTVSTYSYSAFGNLNSESGPDICRFKFSSKERDNSTSFYYYGYRFYSPQWQRWLSEDVLGEIGGINLYQFVENKPIVAFDERGLLPGLGVNPILNPIILRLGVCAGIAAARYAQMKWNNVKNSDKWYHCVTSCEITKVCGAAVAEILGDMKEWTSKDPVDSAADQQANQVGRNLGSCGQKSCEAGCTEKGYSH